MFSRESLARLVDSVKRGIYEQYIGSHFVELNGCTTGYLEYADERYRVCLFTLDRSEPYLLIYYPEYDPLEVPPKFERIYP